MPPAVTSPSLNAERDPAPAARLDARGRLQAVDGRLIDLAHRHGLMLVRAALGLVFVWFGVLKLTGTSPVSGLVTDTLFFLPAAPTLAALGIVEVLIGVGLITGLAIRATMLLFFGQMAGTFLTVVVLPGELVQGGNPFALTVLGEFVVKNLVLVAAGVAVLSAIPKSRGGEGLASVLTARISARGR